MIYYDRGIIVGGGATFSSVDGVTVTRTCSYGISIGDAATNDITVSHNTITYSLTLGIFVTDATNSKVSNTR